MCHGYYATEYILQCSWTVCGKTGRQRRKVNCRHKDGNKVRKKLCKVKLAKRLKPKKKRKCGKKQCRFIKYCLFHIFRIIVMVRWVP